MFLMMLTNHHGWPRRHGQFVLSFPAGRAWLFRWPLHRQLCLQGARPSPRELCGGEGAGLASPSDSASFNGNGPGPDLAGAGQQTCRVQHRLENWARAIR
ncbi:unnamed protein product [Prorocentrum cordatum]|uniref:Uncharacterized protein n=1 Tax=Prorocentrum cordatum TaxID=2364126 RepID=A0ABN9X4V5_9DINO|nr:unnamed protein product [Polarella glacialis]